MIHARPLELQLENCVIRTSYGTGGRVIEVCPHSLDSPLGGWTIVYLDRHGVKCWINEVSVEDGQIRAYPWGDRIEVVERGTRQLHLF